MYIIHISLSCCAACTDFSVPLPSFVPIVHRSQAGLPCISTELLLTGSTWSPYTCSSVRRGPQEYIIYELTLTSPAVSRMSCSSSLEGFQDGWYVPVQLLLCGMLPPGFVQYSSQHSYAIAVKLFLHTLSQHSDGASIQQYRHDCCLVKNCTLFYLIGLASI